MPKHAADHSTPGQSPPEPLPPHNLKRQFCLPQITSIVTVGALEGVSHVNWRQYFKLVAWWYLGCIPVFLFTAFLFWQGAVGSDHRLHVLHQGW